VEPPSGDAGWLVGRRAELSRLVRDVRPAGLRVVPVVVGPSGIGKTRLSRAAARRLHEEGYLALHIQVAERPASLGDLYKLLTTRLGVSFSSLVGEALAAAVSAAFRRLLGEDWQEMLPATAAQLGHGVGELLAELFIELVERARRGGRKGVVVFIDEAQNLFQGLEPGELWGFIKSLSGLQEDTSLGGTGFQAVLITSEYSFQQRLLASSPGPDYLDTFYLGEMTRSDALALYQRLRGAAPSREEEELIDAAAGGHPVHLGIAAKRGAEALCRHIRRFQQLFADQLGGGGERVLQLLERLIEEPLPRTVEAVRLLGVFVERVLLQYACGAYVGVYSWNTDCSEGDEAGCGGGGWCGGLDTVAASSRLARLGLALALGRVDSVPWLVRRLCGLPDASV